MTTDLVTWLRAQLDEDERGVEEWTRPRPDLLLSKSLRPVHELTDRVGPRRMLAEVDAKRRILDEHQRDEIFAECLTCRIDDSSKRHDWPCPTLVLLAAPYADRPGYRDEWRP